MRSADNRLIEAVGLALALDLEIRLALTVPVRKVTPATVFGSGKVAEIGAICSSESLDLVVVDDCLTPGQQRNLERAWNVKVLDRTGLILEIFARRARTCEGRLQVELARLNYERSRLVRTWTHLERQRGGLGVMGGPGETQIETDRRLLADRIKKLSSELSDVRRTRSLHRAARERTPFPTIALVGYTNAGKSSLFNRLTAATVEAKDQLFATLDPTLRNLRLPGGRSGIISDTVGFISDLPHELVEAFRATLEEVQQADVVLHVRDIASPDSAAQEIDVETVLGELGASAAGGRTCLQVWNKADLLSEVELADRLGEARRQGAVLVSAQTGEGCEALLATLASLIDRAAPVAFSLSSADGEALAWLYRHGRVLEQGEERQGRMIVRARLEPSALGRFERQFPDAVALDY